ncbi:MAG: hypothetical protein ACJAS1_007201 [Oleiphilaceae bacterium]|jgi:hypothetical protein
MLFRAIKDITGLSMAGKMQKYVNRYKNDLNTFDPSKVSCSVSEGGYRTEKYYMFSASCYCDDASALASLSYSLHVYSSKKFETRVEAEAALDIEIIATAKVFTDSCFYKYRYYPEDDVEGELLKYKNLTWSIVENDNLYRCLECLAEFSEKPKSTLCTKCGGLFL